jgi:hypothetical protein
MQQSQPEQTKPLLDPKAVARIRAPKEEDHINLVEQIGLLLRFAISPSAEKAFLETPMVKDVYNNNNAYQRVILNRYFATTMYRFRANNPVNITGAIPLLFNDGFTEDWLSIMKDYVIPFIKNNKIMC